MRDFKSMKRQRGRNRKPGGGGAQGHGNNPNRAFDSNGPEGIKVRGNAQHVYERYQQLARDATSAGDRVLAENFLQHAEHYFRLIRAMQPNRPVAEIAARDATAAGFDIDFEDESGVPQVDPGYLAEQAAQEKNGQQPQDGEQRGEDREFRRDRDNRDRDNRDRGENRDRDFNRDRDRDNRDRPRDDRPRDDRPRDDRPRDDRPRDDRPRDDRPRDDRPRDDRPREDRPREDRAAAPQDGEGRRETRRERFERQRGDRRPRYGEEDRANDPLAVVQPVSEPLVAREEKKPSPRLRSENGDESHMPAFLGRAAPSLSDAADEAPADKPKRAPRKKKVADEAADA